MRSKWWWWWWWWAYTEYALNIADVFVCLLHRIESGCLHYLAACLLLDVCINITYAHREWWRMLLLFYKISSFVSIEYSRVFDSIIVQMLTTCCYSFLPFLPRQLICQKKKKKKK